MSATSGGFGNSYKHIGNANHPHHYNQQISGAFLEPLGMQNDAEGFHVTSRHHQDKAFAYEPLPMGGAPGVNQTLPREMLSAPTCHAGQRRGTVVGTAKSKKVKGDGKRSRQELNRREQERVQQLNDRIDQIKEQLHDAGVKTKKTKQSVLDNAAFYIEQLQGDLVIAQQKAAMAATEAATANQTAHSGSEVVYERCFHQSTTPRMLVDVNMKPLAVNAAFMEHSGHDKKRPMKKSHARMYLTTEKGRLEMILKAIREKNKPLAVATTATSSQGDVHVMLTASPVIDDNGKLVKIEFSLIPLDGTSDKEVATHAPGDGMDEVLF